MKGAKLLVGAITFVMMLSGVVIAVEVPHDEITIEGVRPAGFNHDTHLVHDMKCGVCHHKSTHEPFSNQEVIAQSKGTTLHCGHCHNEKFENEELRNLKIVMHKQCKGCHMVGYDGIKGPTRCIGCHKESQNKAIYGSGFDKKK